uniref:Uncharacterized protein n=1 Tax=Anguilla anguilla TaxID=7936 RepID=A0A0E9VZ70_ANGAN
MYFTSNCLMLTIINVLQNFPSLPCTQGYNQFDPQTTFKGERPRNHR